MPYGLSKKIGGDTASNDAKMESCIKQVMAKGTPKLNAILICKSAIQKGGRK
jgi:hypothetical protein